MPDNVFPRGSVNPTAGGAPAPAPPGVPPQNYVTQPVYQPQAASYPVTSPPVATRPAPNYADQDAVEQAAESPQPEIVLVSHSGLFYWWPVWAAGYLMALFTWWHGQSVQIGDSVIRIHPSNNLGILYFLLVFLVILISNIEVRGVSSLAVVLGLVLTVVLLAYFQVWDNVLHWFGNLTVYLNQGAYFWFSTLMFITWLLTTFVFDRMTHWVIKPGQVTREHFWGTGSQSYDTENMTLEKRRNDLFRHWILGLGSGDLRIHTFGGRQEEIFIPNVLFIGFKIEAIQRLIAEEPAEFGRATIK